MGLETGTWISDLVPTNPAASDLRSQGDDHLRLIKSVEQNTFPNATKAFYFPSVAAKSADFTVVLADMHKMFSISTTSGPVIMTLPTLAAGDAGWSCSFVKVTGDRNPIFVTPASGTVLTAGIPLARARRAIPGVVITCLWLGTLFQISRAVSVAVGACLEWHGTVLPAGYEWPLGQTLTSAITDYPEYYFSVNGTGVVLDKRGRVGIPLDNLGGVNAGRLGAGFISGTAFSATGGLDAEALRLDQLPGLTAVQNGLTIGVDSTVNDILRGGASDNFTSTAGSGQFNSLTKNQIHSTGTINISAIVAGSGGAGAGVANTHSNLQPSIMVTEIVVVE